MTALVFFVSSAESVPGAVTAAALFIVEAEVSLRSTVFAGSLREAR